MGPMLQIVLWSLLACSANASDDEVASIMLVQGEATVIDGGAAVPAAVGVTLTRDDVVRTDFGGAVILHLHNNHLVRVDEDLELPVSQIVLLDAAPVTLDARGQLASLVYPEERGTMAGLADAERVAGWHARLTAGYTPGAEPVAAPGPTRGGPTQRPSTARQDAPVASAPPAPAMEAAEPAPEPEQAEAKERGKKAGPPPPAPPPPRYGRADLEAKLQKGEVHDAIVAWARGLPVPVESVTFEVRVKDGRIRGVVAHGGLTPPPEVRALVGAWVAETGSFTVVVPVQ